MTIESIALWHQRARPNPTDANFNVQLGCHLEEVAEMIESMRFLFKSGSGVEMPGKTLMLYQQLSDFADALKAGRVTAHIADTDGLLDAMADQIVTAVGVGHCANTNIVKAVAVVNSSNWSKFDKDGQPIFDQNGKILKGPDYTPPNLEGLY
jgi:predicted HAD superfamily Cof-like phosphohydrolase